MPRSYSLPDFNLTCDIWRVELGGPTVNWPWARPARAPDSSPVCQLYLAQKSLGTTSAPFLAANFNLDNPPVLPQLLRLPLGTVIGSPVPHAFNRPYDVVEVPSGSGYLYLVVSVERAHAGFPNAYLVAYLVPYVHVGTPDQEVNHERLDIAAIVDVSVGN